MGRTGSDAKVRSASSTPDTGTVRAGKSTDDDLGGVRELFDSFKKDAKGCISRVEIMERLRQAGITPEDPRIRDVWASLEESDGDGQRLDLARFTRLCQRNRRLLARAVTGGLVVLDRPESDRHFDGLRQDPGDDEGERHHGERTDRLLAQLRQTAHAVDGQDTHEQGADQTAYQVDTHDIQRVVVTQPVLQIHRPGAQHTRHDTDEDRAEGVDVRAGGGDGYQAGDRRTRHPPW